MWAKQCCLTVVGLLAAGVTVVPAAQEASTRPAIVTAEQCAADGAFTKLVDAALALELADDTSVAELWATISAGDAGASDDLPVRALELVEQGLRERLLRACQFSKGRQVAGGAIEVDANVPMTEVEKIVRELTAELSRGETAEVVIRAPGGPTLTAKGRWHGAPPAHPGPAGWRHCDAVQLEQVAAAARLDARQRLLEAIGRWQLSASQRVIDVWARQPEFRMAVEQLAEMMPLSGPTFERTGLCRLTGRLERPEIVKLLTAAAQRCTGPIDADLASAIDPAGREVLIIEGLAVAPPFAPQSRPSADKEAADRPDWASRSLTTQVTGRAPAEVTEPADRLHMAVTAAAVEGKRQLWLQIEGLALVSGKTVGDVLIANRHSEAIKAIQDAFSIESPTGLDEDGRVTLTLSIPLEAVWRAVADLSSGPSSAPHEDLPRRHEGTERK